MAKSKDATGKMDEQLKEKLENPDLSSVENTKVTVDPESFSDANIGFTEEMISEKSETMPFKGETPEPETLPFEGSPEMISKPEVDLLARKFANAKKEDQLPLRETIQEVKDRNKSLQELKKSRKQQSVRIIRDLRQYDPIGKKTCGRCAHRVLIETMDSKKELCEVCAS